MGIAVEVRVRHRPCDRVPFTIAGNNMRRGLSVLVRDRAGNRFIPVFAADYRLIDRAAFTVIAGVSSGDGTSVFGLGDRLIDRGHVALRSCHRAVRRNGSIRVACYGAAAGNRLAARSRRTGRISPCSGLFVPCAF